MEMLAGGMQMPDDPLIIYLCLQVILPVSAKMENFSSCSRASIMALQAKKTLPVGFLLAVVRGPSLCFSFFHVARLLVGCSRFYVFMFFLFFHVFSRGLVFFMFPVCL